MTDRNARHFFAMILSGTMVAARVAFWAATVFIVYVYLGYPAWLWVRCRWWPRTNLRAPITSSISVVMVVRDEIEALPQKVADLLKLHYPGGSEIIIVSDGSTDGTSEFLSKLAGGPRFNIVLNCPAQGKASGLNAAMRVAKGEIVVFTDARQRIEADAVRWLLEDFADPEVGCVSGELMIGIPGRPETIGGMGLYWRLEKHIRRMESRSGSVIGVTGALYAVRRHFLEPIPAETILDDVYIPMQILRQGARVVFREGARIWEAPGLGTDRDFARKVRTLSGNYQLLQIAPWLLTRANPARFEFISHKLLRLLVPCGLIAVFLGSLLLVQHPFYRFALILQLAFYALAASSRTGSPLFPLARAADAAFTFVLLNTAAIMAMANFITGRKIAWRR